MLPDARYNVEMSSDTNCLIRISYLRTAMHPESDLGIAINPEVTGER